MSGSRFTVTDSELEAGAAAFDEISAGVGEFYSAGDFVRWFLREAKRERKYHAPAGRPKQTRAENFHPNRHKAEAAA